ncbi:MAG: PIN domain-containing protein [Hyphomicrobiaceae bacterium]|nr:PIN domain-containing protein [Hyphomicrobiaceae bacterium]
MSEIGAGLRSQKERPTVRRFFRKCELLRVSVEIAENAGAHLRHSRSSHAFGIADAIIAATAKNRGLLLATLNVKHVPMFRGLTRAS